MVDVKVLKEKIKGEVDAAMPRLVEMSDWIGKHPELGSEEVEASKLLAGELGRHGFKVEMGVLGMPTAFKAVYRGKGKGPRIAFLCEYDALPGVGHGCGHNMIGTSGLGAGIAVSKLMKGLPGELWVVGTPAEEGHGPSSSAKKKMAEAGFFKGVDAVMMIHPMGNSKMTVATGFLAITGINLVFTGKTAHAAADPYNGLNALNAAVLCFMAIHANRQQFKRAANPVVHGIITEGGLANNIIPDRAVMQFGVRSSDDSYIPTLVKMVEDSAKGAAIATGCEVKITVSPGLKSNVRNPPLEKLFVKGFKELGVEAEDPDYTAAQPPGGSTDFTDLSHAVPGMHAMVGFTKAEITGHSRELCAATLTEEGHRGIEIGAKVLALAGVEVLTDAKLRAEIKDAFDEAEK
ncbi:MAG: M20 family metallopeptidase [Candidatus Bathyarchaeia archaeon]